MDKNKVLACLDKVIDALEGKKNFDSKIKPGNYYELAKDVEWGPINEFTNSEINKLAKFIKGKKIVVPKGTKVYYRGFTSGYDVVILNGVELAGEWFPDDFEVKNFSVDKQVDIDSFKKDLYSNGWRNYKELNDSISDACTEYGKDETADKPNETWINKSNTKAVSFFDSLGEIATINIHGPSIHDWDWVITDQPISLIKSISITPDSIRFNKK